jgi:uncharacterized membrane protein YhaH (DUF805 family)
MVKFFSEHFGGLLRFSGREARQPFWLWVAFNMALQMFVALVTMIPMMVSTFGNIERFANEHPDQVTRTYGPGSYSVQINGHHPELMPDFSGMFIWIGLGALLTVILLAAAVVRRLHDCNRRGAWALLPIPNLAIAMMVMPSLFGGFSEGKEPELSLFFLMFFNNLFYIVLLVVLAVLCAQPGTPGENRFGPPPTD